MKTITAYETKKVIYETIVKEIYINPETAHALTQVIYDNLQAAQQSEQADEPKCKICGDTGVAGPTWAHPEGEKCDCNLLIEF